MELYLMRHGIAADLGTDGITRDRDRPLTSRGARRVRRVAEALRELELDLDLVLASPFARARETAEIVVEVLGIGKRLELTPHLAIPADSPRLIQELNGRRPTPSRVLLVGHEPHLGDLTTLLTTGGANPAITFRKAGLCRLEVGSLQAGRCATLEWLLPARLLCRIR
jgi:phosphohistidine phosphatase